MKNVNNFQIAKLRVLLARFFANFSLSLLVKVLLIKKRVIIFSYGFNTSQILEDTVQKANGQVYLNNISL